jgi:hypothetical protein
MAIAYGQDPAILAGIDPRAEPWLAWQFRRAVYAFGEWFDRQREATIERPVPKDHKPMMRVPKYDEARLRAMLGLDSEPPDGSVAGTDPADELARSLLRGTFWTDDALGAPTVAD